MDLRPSERLRLRIEQGKYRKDRFAMLPQNSWNCRATGVASPNLGFGWTKYGNPSATRVIDTRKRTLGAHLNIRVRRRCCEGAYASARSTSRSGRTGRP